MPDSPTNRLVKEKSPYLLQHAHNPVDWYPWGEEAFERARTRDVPIFLSIGYATCHWCHVMERESFEDEELAEELNEAFVCVKVDREELPEVDSLYMEFAQGLMSGMAGWPLTVLLTPDLKPFFAATYLPPRRRGEMLGVKELIAKTATAWSGPERQQLEDQADSIVEVFRSLSVATGDLLPPREAILKGAEVIVSHADPVYGGMQGAPKFPVAYQLSFLIRCYRQLADNRPLFVAERTLECMYRGGIYDHLGGGFSRYSVDEKWLVPHFEKMLYDNAIIVSTYLEAYLITQRPLYRRVAEETLGYLMREMIDSGGGFYSAQDAETEGKEGLFYTWTPSELVKVLGHEEGRAFAQLYGVDQDGHLDGRSVLHLPAPLATLADKANQPVDKLEQDLAQMRQKLWEVRQKREQPFLDDKVLTSWNGLAIHAFAMAGRVLQDDAYLHVAEQAAQFIYDNLFQDSYLLHRWRDGEARFSATLDDYAYLIKGLLTLFEAGRGVRWLMWARQLTEILNDKFKAQDGAYYQTDGDDRHLVLRKCLFADGAEPSGNAVQVENLLRLHQLTLAHDYRENAKDVIRAVRPLMDQQPMGYAYHLMALQRYYSPNAVLIIVALNQKQEGRQEVARALSGGFIPHAGVIWKEEGDKTLARELPFLKDYQPVDGKTTFYRCYQGACQQPLNQVEEIVEAIEKLWV